MYTQAAQQGPPTLQCTAESNACLFCKASCCLFTLLQGFQHSTCNVTACRAHDRQHTYTPQSRASSALQCTAESNACLLSDMLAANIQAQLSLRTCSVSQKSQHAEHMKGSIDTCHKAASAALQCTAESNACLLYKHSAVWYACYKDSDIAHAV